MRPAFEDGVFVVLVAVLAFALNAANWVFSSDFDSMNYLNAFTDPIRFMRDYGEHYQMDRMPWILLGGAFFSVLPPRSAEIGLHFFVFLVAIGFFHAAARRLHGRRAAAVVTLLFVASPTALTALGMNYVSPFVIACLCAALYGLVLYGTGTETGAPPALGLFIAGLFFSLAAVTNLGSGYVSLSLVLALLICLRPAPGEIGRIFGVFFVLAVLVVLSLSASYYLFVDGDPVFFRSTFEMMAKTYFQDPWWSDRSIPHYVRGLFVTPILTLGGVIVHLILVQWVDGEEARVQRLTRFSAFAFLLFAVIFIALFLNGRVQVSKPHRYSFALPLLYLASAGVLAPVFGELSKNAYRALLGAVGVGCFAPFWAYRDAVYMTQKPGLEVLYLAVLAGSLGLFAATMKVAVCERRPSRFSPGPESGARLRTAVLRAFLALCVISGPYWYLIDGNRSLFQQIARDFWMPKVMPDKDDSRRALNEAIALVNRTCPEIECTYWYNRDHKLGWTMEAIRAMKDDIDDIRERARWSILPEMPCPVMAKIPKIVILTSDVKSRARAFDTISGCGFRFTPIVSRTVGQGKVVVNLDIGSLEP